AGTCRLEARGKVGGLARDQELAPLVRRGDDLAGRDADTQLESGAELLLEERIELDQALAHGQRGAHRPLGVVLVDLGHPEDGHDRIARVFLHGAPEAPDLLTHLLEEGCQELAKLLWIVALGKLGGARQIGEEYGDDISLVAGGHGFKSPVRAVMLRESSPRARWRLSAGLAWTSPG